MSIMQRKIKYRIKSCMAMLLLLVLIVGSFHNKYALRISYASDEMVTDSTGNDVELIKAFLIDPVNMLQFTDKVELNKILECLPSSLDVMISENQSIVSIPVTWECLGNYEETNYYYYQFNPKWDESMYVIDKDVVIPYVGVFLENMVSTISVTGTSNEATIYNFLRNTLGCNKATAVGILANIYCESSFNPQAECIDSNGLTSYGICQWNGDRFTALKNWCSSNGYSYSSLSGQLNYLKHELNSSEAYAWGKLQGIEDTAEGAYTAAYRWAQYFERCSSVYYQGRANLAKNTYWPSYGGVVDATPTVYSDNLVGGENSIYISGWAYDPDTLDDTVTIHVYVDGTHKFTYYANKERNDVNEKHGCGMNHGYEEIIPYHVSSEETHEITIYALNTTYNQPATTIVTKTVTITPEKQGPEITNVKVSDVSEKGYTITCTVNDSSGIDRVQFPTWTEFHEQDDIQSDWHTSSVASGIINGNEVTYRVNTREHNNESGIYHTHIYAYDVYGNRSKCSKTIIAVGEEVFTPTAEAMLGTTKYVLYNTSVKSWTEAKTYCESVGGNLATINTAEEEELIESLISSSDMPGYWLGATDESEEGNWTWVTGEYMSYSKWGDGEPNNQNGNQNYLYYRVSSDAWDDSDHLSESETTQYGFIMEFGNDVVMPTHTPEVQEYTVIFLADNKIIDTQIVKHGSDAILPVSPSKVSDSQYSYIFKGWDKSHENVQSDMMIHAIFEAQEINKYTLGDVNDDGDINAADALAVLKYSAKISSLTKTQLSAADTSKDGNINASDALLILKYAAKLLEQF